MVLFLNSWYRKFINDFKMFRENKSTAFMDKYINRIPKRATVGGLLNILTEEDILSLLTPRVSYTYWGESPNGSSADGFYFHINKEGNGYVFYGSDRRSLFNFFENKNIREVCGAYISAIFLSLNHEAKDLDQYTPIEDSIFREE